MFWGAGRTELISKRIFRPIEMYGVTRYMYRPDVRTLQFVTGASGVYRAMEMEDTPALRRALARLDTTRLAEASFDQLGFRRVDPELARDCAMRVLFLGDSFTDGVYMDDRQTGVNQYGHLARERGRIAVCPINIGAAFGRVRGATVVVAAIPLAKQSANPSTRGRQAPMMPADPLDLPHGQMLQYRHGREDRFRMARVADAAAV